ncbi:MAG: peptidase BlaR1 [Bacillales bacterium]|jgi:hypothetical protein|nr:peptidase BlaR1 [Bacillales bacterium]
MKKLIVVSIILCTGILGLAGCAPSKEELDGYTKLLETNDVDSYTQMLNNKTDYIGDNNKVAAIVNALPEINPDFKQQYFSIQSDGTNGLKIFYEPKADGVIKSISFSQKELESYAAMLFAFIGNAEEIQFMVRDTMGASGLDETKYQEFAHYTREDIIKNFGDLAQFYVKEKFNNLVGEAQNQLESFFSIK